MPLCIRLPPPPACSHSLKSRVSMTRVNVVMGAHFTGSVCLPAYAKLGGPTCRDLLFEFRRGSNSRARFFSPGGHQPPGRRWKRLIQMKLGRQDVTMTVDARVATAQCELC